MSEINIMPTLAIVIPAYKSRYFGQALESIANQTCKNFTLYIGDDASPDDLVSIVNSFRNDIRIVYKRFLENLGGKDLVAHWERCIDMTRDEEWIWLFSDDDMMSDNCVKAFYEILTKYDKESAIDKVFRFNLSVIDTDLNLLQKYVTPQDFSVKYFLECYFVNHDLRNKAVEFIFSKKKYFEKGKFVNFPLAWGSDTATMLKFGQPTGYVTIEKGEVFWRDSSYNISSHGNAEINNKKLNASRQFYTWLFKFIKVYEGSKFYKKLIFHILLSQYPLPSIFKLKNLDIDQWNLNVEVLCWIFIIKIKRILRYTDLKRLLKPVKN